MSLGALSTELDNRIIGYLQNDRHALDAMSRISKYYRSVTEPILYRHIAFPVADDHQIRYLLMTLLDRKYLRKCIKSFMLSPQEQFNHTDAQEIAFSDRFQSYIIPIHGIIQDIKHPDLKSPFLLKWHANILGKRRSVDGALAVILCLVTQIDRIKICYSSLDLTLRTLELPWLQVAKNRPFNNLVEFTLEGSPYGMFNIGIPLLPSLKVVRTRSCDVVGITAPLGSASSLHTFYVEKVDSVHAWTIQKDLSKSFFHEVRHLRMTEIDITEWNNHDYSCQGLIEALCQHTPHLETLEYVHIQRSILTLLPDFGAFKAFPKLQYLHANVGLLILPSSLRTLKISEITVSQIEDLQYSLAATTGDRAMAPNLLSDGVRRSSLRHLQFEVALETWQPGDYDRLTEDDEDEWECWDLIGPCLEFLSDTADRLKKHGVLFEVFRQEGLFDRFKKRLISPGFIDAGPHSRDPTEEARREITD